MTEHDRADQHQRKSSVKMSLSALRDAPKCIPTPLTCPDFSDLEDSAGNTPAENPAGKQRWKSRDLSESPYKERRSDNHRTFNKEKVQPQRRSPRPSTGSPVKGKRKIAAATRLKETKSHTIPENVNSSSTSEKGKEKMETFLTRPVVSPNVNSSSCVSPPANPDRAAVKRSKETFSPSGKKERRAPRSSRLSMSSLVRSVTLSGGSQSVAFDSADGDDVFEDYFSPANNHQEARRQLLPHLPVKGSIHIPFELDSVVKKRKHRTDESPGSETYNNKKKKFEEKSSDKNQQSDTEIEHQGQSLVVEGSPGRSINNITQAVKKGRQSTLPFKRTSTSDATKQRRASTSTSKFMERNASDLQKNSVKDLSHTMESE